MLRIQWPILLLALPLPWLLRAMLTPASDSAKGCLYLPFSHQLESPPSTPPLSSRHAMPIVVWLLLIAAAIRPQWLGTPMRVAEQGRNLILALDISGSMAATDLDPGGRRSRLDIVKRLAGEFIDQRVGDRVGLILFGSNAYLQAPPTFDRDTVRQWLDQTEIGIAGRETAIGHAIGLAIRLQRRNAHGDAVLILMTDGANTAGLVSPRRAAAFAAATGLRIHTIGVGANDEPAPLDADDPAVRLDEPLLEAIASQTGGHYFRATDRRTLRRIYRQLNRLEPVSRNEQIIRPVFDLYPWPLGGALLLSFAMAWQHVKGHREWNR